MNDALKRTSLNARRLAAKLTTLAAGLMLASVAVAHVFPQKQEPGAGATVTSVTQVRVIFDGPLEPGPEVGDGGGQPTGPEREVGAQAQRRRQHG